jgi:hypothetical protein
VGCGFERRGVHAVIVPHRVVTVNAN